MESLSNSGVFYFVSIVTIEQVLKAAVNNMLNILVISVTIRQLQKAALNDM